MDAAQILHASCVAADGRGLLILGPSGAGKSSMAMQLIALGAQLVADDRTVVFAQNNSLIAHAPPATAGLIEARGIGILRLPHCPRACVVAALDLAQPDTALRMPALRSHMIAGVEIDFLHMQSGVHFPSALMCYLMGQRSE
jgi:HPr kinase/phosphorylase